MSIKVGDIVAIRVKVKSITEEEGNVFKYTVKALSGNDYSTMSIMADDIVGTTLNVPKETEDING